MVMRIFVRRYYNVKWRALCRYHVIYIKILITALIELGRHVARSDLEVIKVFG